MRLTLRTLLAYLDDVLDPNESREIGQKINESKEAMALVEQVREALRRRRIAAPELAGPGSGPDPNIVSEYLESVLPPNQVVEFEQLCRGSELHLAEVAACHKILTHIKSQPIEVSDDLCERMYALGASRPSMAGDQAPELVPQMTDGLTTEPGGTSFDESLPDYLKRERRSGKIWSTLVVLLMIGAWLGLVIPDESIWSTVSEPDNDEELFALAGSDEESDPDAESPAATADPVSSTTPHLNQVVGDQVPKRSDEMKQQANVSVNPDPPPDASLATSTIQAPLTSIPIIVPEEGEEAANRPSKLESATPAEKSAVPGVVAPADNDAKVPTTAEKGPRLTDGALSLIKPSGVNIVLTADSKLWETIDSGLINVGDEFAVPPPFDAEFVFRDELRVKVLSESRIQRLAGNDDADLRLLLKRGRLVISRPETSLNPQKVEIQIGSQTRTFTFSETSTELAIEAVLPQPTGRPNGLISRLPHGDFGVISGKLKAAVGVDLESNLDISHGWLAWNHSKENPTTGGVFPNWTGPEIIPTTPAQRQLRAAYSREFELDVFRSVAPVVSDRRASISDLAVRTMVLIDHHLDIVPALQSDHEETRTSTINALREWLAADSRREELLLAEMERNFPVELSQTMLEMLWGYSRADAQSPEVSQLLLTRLDDDELAVRELAVFHMVRLSGRSYGFHAQAPDQERRAAINRWIDYLERNKSLVKSE